MTDVEFSAEGQRVLPADATAHLVEFVQSAMDSGKITVFIIGAGVSNDYVPTMEDMFFYLCESFAEDSKANAVFRDIADQARRRVRKRIDNLPRSVIYSLYSDLQDKSQHTSNDIWQRFSLDMLSGRIRSLALNQDWSNTMIMPKIPPTECHSSLAKLVGRFYPNVLVISLNFDGLMAKAIRQTIKRGDDGLDGLRVLTSKDSVKQFFGARQSDDRVALPLLKLRGDIFHAVCTTENCNRFGQEVPVYELDFDDEFSTDLLKVEEQLKESIKCRDCGEVMRLSITFPGIRKKDQENVEILAELLKMLGHRIGCAVSIGTSGRWDNAVVEFMNTLHESFDARLAVVFRSNPPLIADKLGDKCLRIESKADGLAVTLEQSLNGRTMIRDRSEGPRGGHHSYKMAFDGVWLRERGTEKLPLSVRTRDGSEMAFSYDASGHGLDGQLLELKNLSLVDRLAKMSQLGIKNEVLHTEQSEQERHTRKNHCLGAAFVALAWYNVLLAKRPKTLLKHVATVDLRHLVISAFLHDIGHLSFGHLTEEIMHELNWTSVSNPDIYSHEDIDFTLYEESNHSNLECVLGQSLRLDTALLKALIRGSSGRLFCDSIINSGIDCDKIDYIFRDTVLTRKAVRLDDPYTWLYEFVYNQEVTSEGLIRLNGLSALRTIELLEERLFLYENFYLSPEVRILESVCRTILISWLVPQVPGWLDQLPSNGSGHWKAEDTRSYKGRQAALAMNGIMNAVSREEDGQSLNTTVEVAFLRRIIEQLDAVEVGLVDKSFAEWLRSLANGLNGLFDKLRERRTGQPSTVGFKRPAFVEYVSDFDILGDWRINKKDSRAVREICRELKVEYPCTVIFDVAEMPQFWSTPARKTLLYDGSAINCTDFLLPQGPISKWNKQSIGKVPASDVDFRSLHKPFAQVLLIRPPESHRGRCLWVRDLFREKCEHVGINLEYENSSQAQ